MYIIDNFLFSYEEVEKKYKILSSKLNKIFKGTESDERGYWVYLQEDYDEWTEQLVNQISNQARKKYNYLGSIHHSHFSGYTYGMSCKIHRDEPTKNGMTLLYYFVPTWKLEWEGFTYFFLDSTEKDKPTQYTNNYTVSKAVIPFPSRTVLFDSSIEHQSGSISRICPHMKIILAINFNVDGTRI